MQLKFRSLIFTHNQVEQAYRNKNNSELIFSELNYNLKWGQLKLLFNFLMM